MRANMIINHKVMIKAMGNTRYTLGCGHSQFGSIPMRKVNMFCLYFVDSTFKENTLSF